MSKRTGAASRAEQSTAQPHGEAAMARMSEEHELTSERDAYLKQSQFVAAAAAFEGEHTSIRQASCQM